VVGKIPYLNSVPFYEYFEKRQFRIMPMSPRRMGVLARKNQIDAGLFSLADYLSQEQELESLGFGIATRDQVKSVLLFSNHGWRDLEGKTIGITDDTATSVLLLKVLLEKKYGLQAHLERMHTGVNNYAEYDAVLLIGDDALRYNKAGPSGFEIVYDLAREWYEWQKLPFVFAVWAVRKSLEAEVKEELRGLIAGSLERGESDFEHIGIHHARRIGLSGDESAEYLGGFNYRLGERELQAIHGFRSLLQQTEETLKRATDV